MIAAEIPHDEARRLVALRGLNVLDSDPEAEFDSLARTAAALCAVPIALLTLVDGERLWVKASWGLPGAGEESVMQAAEDCCCAARADGGNRVRMWFDTDAGLQARSGEAQCAAQVEQALDEDRFVLFAQRIEPLGPHLGGLHAEVLLRMVASDGSLVSPALFLPAAERFQMATRIDRWVLRRTIEWMGRVAEPCAIGRISVNLSGQSVGDREFHLWALALLAQVGDAICHRLCLEITETAAVTHMVDAAAFVDQVHALGVLVALDDFGAGASSFGYLKNLRVDCLKIDGQFIRGLPDDPLDAAAVRCFVDVARVMGIETVAEFVDRPAVLDCVRGLGVDLVQGFLLHRPAPIDELVAPELEDRGDGRDPCLGAGTLVAAPFDLAGASR